MPKLVIDSVSKYYGKIAAVDNVSLEVEDKEYVCVIGPSGCGKSTLIKCIAGIIKPDQGEILIDGRSSRHVLIEDRKIGYVFQDIALFPHMTVRDNLAYGLAVRDAGSEHITRVSNEMLDLIKMRERSKSFPSELSGGAQQKVAVARAIATGSYLFLLDEPLGALDALVRAELRYELKQLAKDLGLTIIHVTHDQEEALSIADRVVIMKQGRVVEIGTPADVYLRPKTLFTENFVGETNILEGEIAEMSGDRCTIRIGGQALSVYATNRKTGDKVAISIRPEAVHLRRGSEEGRIKGNVKQAVFLGSINRYQVETIDGVTLTAHQSTISDAEEFRVGEAVNIQIDERNMLLFNSPPEGLEKELALEELL
jgi:putative spermidine/putrescine transport system ATP-binding protein